MAAESRTVTVCAGMSGEPNPLVVFHRYGQHARMYRYTSYQSRRRVVKVARARAIRGHGAVGLRSDGWYYTDFQVPMFADPNGRVLVI